MCDCGKKGTKEDWIVDNKLPPWNGSVQRSECNSRNIRDDLKDGELTYVYELLSPKE